MATLLPPFASLANLHVRIQHKPKCALQSSVDFHLYVASVSQWLGIPQCSQASVYIIR